MKYEQLGIGINELETAAKLATELLDLQYKVSEMQRRIFCELSDLIRRKEVEQTVKQNVWSLKQEVQYYEGNDEDTDNLFALLDRAEFSEALEGHFCRYAPLSDELELERSEFEAAVFGQQY